jgi:hypothetical protein
VPRTNTRLIHLERPSLSVPPGETTGKRPLRAKTTASLSVAPVIVSDESAAVVVGLEPRQFREFVVRHQIPHARDGRRLLVRVDSLLAAMERIESSAPAPAPEGEVESADDILRRLGRKRVAIPGGAQ